MSRILIVAVVGIGAALLIVGSRLFSKAPAPAPGSAAPDFKLASDDGSAVSLKDYRGKWVVLYFYPKDFTSGCTIEAHNFQRDQAEFQKRNAVVLGVSVDSVESHKNFCAREGLNFKLLADTSHEVSTQYGSLMNFGFVKISARHTFLIDPDGQIARSYMSVNPMKHSAEMLAAIDEASAGFSIKASGVRL
jgi:peroxiredoxin Q/BCP